MLNEKHAEWIERRGLDVELLAKYGVKSNGPRIAVPYQVQGCVRYAKNFDPMDKQNTRCLPTGVDQIHMWNEDCLELEEVPPHAVLIITEGEFDALACLQAGAQFVVSLPSGAKAIDRSLTRKDSDGEVLLRDCIAKFRRVLVFTDCDRDGLEAREKIVELIGADFCYVPEFPEGCKDANDILREFGEQGLYQVIERCEPVKSDGFMPLTQARRSPKPKQLDFGLPFISPMIKLSMPEFFVIGGQSGHGKSTIEQCLLFNLLLQNQQLKASIFHGEGHRSIPAKRATMFYRWNVFGMSEKMGDPEIQSQRDAWLDDRIAFIRPPQDQLPTFEWLLWAMERQALHRKRNVFVIDPWNEVIHKRDLRKNHTDYIGECIIKLKSLADRLGLILIVTHHVAKPKDAKAPPSRYDLADSAHWVNKADHVLLCWKPNESENKTRIEVAKSKDHDLLGKPGHCWVSLNGPHFQLQEVNPPGGYENI